MDHHLGAAGRFAQRGGVKRVGPHGLHLWPRSQCAGQGNAAVAGYRVRPEFFGFRCDHQIVAWQAVLAGVGVGVGMDRVTRQSPQLLCLLPEIQIPALPMWLTAHRELRGTPRLKLVFDSLASAFKA